MPVECVRSRPSYRAPANSAVRTRLSTFAVVARAAVGTAERDDVDEMARNASGRVDGARAAVATLTAAAASASATAGRTCGASSSGLEWGCTNIGHYIRSIQLPPLCKFNRDWL